MKKVLVIKLFIALLFVESLATCEPIWACDVLFISNSSSIMPHWKPEFEERLTYKLTPEQIQTMQSVPSVELYNFWLKNFLSNGWKSEFLNDPSVPNYLFRAYREKQISIHEFMTSMIFYSARKELGEEKSKKIFTVGESNIDLILETEIIWLLPEHRKEFKRRALALPERERTLLRYKGMKNNFLTQFAFGGIITFDTQPYDFIYATGTRAKKENKSRRGTLLSSSLRQVLTDVMYGENSVQHIPTIGSENSLDLVTVYPKKGRSVSFPFPGIKTHFPHEVDPEELPLHVIFHDYYHNERVARVSIKLRQNLIPYLVKFIFDQKGKSFQNIPVVFQQKIDSFPVYKGVNHRLNFMGVQTPAEELTDTDGSGWTFEPYLKHLSEVPYVKDPFSNMYHQLDKYIVLGLIFEDMLTNRDKWASMGFDQYWLEHFIANSDYRIRFLYDLAKQQKFTRSQVPEGRP